MKTKELKTNARFSPPHDAAQDHIDEVKRSFNEQSYNREMKIGSGRKQYLSMGQFERGQHPSDQSTAN